MKNIYLIYQHWQSLLCFTQQLLLNDQWRHKNKLFYQSLLTRKRTVLGFVRILVVDASSKKKKPIVGSLSIVS